MKEELLHFIWKLQLFTSKNLCCSNGEKLLVLTKGEHNLNAGPDFFNAKIEIGDQVWGGNVEIHVNASDWYAHNHEVDENYNAVVLHVVWNNDAPVFGKSNVELPTLELKNFISNDVLKNYQKLFNSPKQWINCENDIGDIDTFQLNNWFERLYIERLEQKAVQIQEVLHKTNNNWEATLFILLTKNFGSKVNSEAFLDVAFSIDFSIVRKVSNNQKVLEALFFGQANLLSDSCESKYFEELLSAYNYLVVKFKLSPIPIGGLQFFRLRPNNFPTIRLSQLATLYHLHQQLFSKVMEVEKVEDFYDLFDVSVSDFWKNHYTFQSTSKKSNKKLSKSFIDLLLINTILPLKFMYLKSQGKNDFELIYETISKIKPEKNSIITKFDEFNIKATNAFETQALLQLKNEYCNKQLCLQCSVGKQLIKN